MKQHNQPMQILNLRIVWFAMFISLFVMGYALFLKVGQVDKSLTSANQVLQHLYIGIGIGFALVAAAIFIPRFQLNKEIKKLHNNFASSGLDKITIHELIVIYLPSYTLRLAILEFVTLIGFALGLYSLRMEVFYPFITISIVGYILNFPTEEKIKSVLLKTVPSSLPIKVTSEAPRIVMEEKEAKVDNILVWPSLAYMFLPIICLISLDSYSESQIDRSFFYSLSFIVNILLLLVVLYSFKVCKTNFSLQLKHKIIFPVILMFGFL